LALAASNGHLPVVLRFLRADQKRKEEEEEGEVEGGAGGRVGRNEDKGGKG